MRLDEEFAKEAFDRFLKSRSESVEWADGPDPPDYLLTAASGGLAVEVTRIVDKVMLAGRLTPVNSLVAALTAFVRRVERTARAGGYLSGVYQLDIEALEDWSGNEPVLREKVLEYLQRTEGMANAPQETLLKQGSDRHWTIQKWHNRGAYLAETIGAGQGSWEGEIGATLTELVSERVTDKENRLRDITQPILLLLVDDYHLGSDRQWLDAVRAAETSSFHTIARVYSDYYCDILCSLNGDWK